MLMDKIKRKKINQEKDLKKKLSILFDIKTK